MENISLSLSKDNTHITEILNMVMRTKAVSTMASSSSSYHDGYFDGCYHDDYSDGSYQDDYSDGSYHDHYTDD